MQQMMQGQEQEQQQEYVSPVNEKFIEKLNTVLKKYTDGKKNLENKIVENDKWYRSQHWELIKGKNNGDPEPVSAYLFSTVANKHADIMDYYPEPNILEREQDDVKEAQNLSHIIPLVIERNRFRKTYSDAAWYKVKQGCSAYGVFWNPNVDGGLGDIDIQKLDLLNIYWQPGITDIQKSQFLFIITLMDDEILNATYPQTKGRISEVKPLDLKTYFTDDSVDLTGKSMVIDCYYKKINSENKEVVHLTKYVDNIPLVSTEDDPETAEVGLYDHGMYPVLFDVLFPEENTPVGFGYIDVVKNPQMYVDKLDQIISKNALQAGKQRTLIKDNGAIDEEELADYSKDIVHTKGGVREGDDYAIMQAKPLPAFIINHRQNKIGELKETSGSNDFSRGEAGGGVTAMGAILALQEAGNKTSRDMIASSYDVYSQMVYMCIELIRQFYDESRSFRVEDNAGQADYIRYNNQGLQPQELPPTYEGEESKHRRPIFDIKVKPEKSSPFSRAAQNEMAKEMFNMGFFNPQRAAEAKVALELMSFEGIEKVRKVVSENGDLFMQLQQVMQQNMQMQQALQGMNEVIKHSTGRDMMAQGGAMGGSPNGEV